MGLKSSDIKLMRFFAELMQKNDVPEDLYGLKGYGEDRTCLEKSNGMWQVYYGNRGHKQQMREHEELADALKDIADRCCDSEEAFDKIITGIDKASHLPLYRGIPISKTNLHSSNTAAKAGYIQVTPQYTMKKRGDCYYIAVDDRPFETQIVASRAGLVLSNAAMHKRTKQGSEEKMSISVIQTPAHKKPAIQPTTTTKKSKAKSTRGKASEKRKKQGVY